MFLLPLWSLLPYCAGSLLGLKERRSRSLSTSVTACSPPGHRPSAQLSSARHREPRGALVPATEPVAVCGLGHPRPGGCFSEQGGTFPPLLTEPTWRCWVM